MTSNGYKQNEISQELSMETKIFKTSYYTVLRAFSFKKIKILTVKNKSHFPIIENKSICNPKFMNYNLKAQTYG
jgi:hypothetical protein